MDSKNRLKQISRCYNSLESAQRFFRKMPAKVWYEQLYDKQLELTMSYMDCLFPNMLLRALDIGCSSGRYTKVLLSKQIEVIGIDTARLPLTCAIQWVPGGRFLQASIVNLPFKRETFDIVVCIELLHHLTDDMLDESLGQIARIIKPGGMFIFDIKNKLNPLLNLVYRRNDSVEFTLKARSMPELMKLVEDKGFKIIKKKGIFFPISILAPYIVCCAINKD